MSIPKAKVSKGNRIPTANTNSQTNNVVFSFKTLDKTKYFNLDATCESWSSDLFDTLCTVSSIPVSDIMAGRYSGKQSPLRIHRHPNANPPSPVPNGIDISELWQIRISLSKGGIHGIFSDNVFYVIWLDPQHNLYPSENHGGLKVIKPPLTCCKDRDYIIDSLNQQITDLKRDNTAYKELFDQQ